ncbi:MAG TPA: hypothetical protein VI036_05230 [Propionibacteriaceae bacterium]|jgi:hypothetical protein
MSAAGDNQSPRYLDAHLHLLDRQVLDVHGVPVAVVDDLELSEIPAGQEIPPDTPPPVITALLSGPTLATRIFGGRPPESRMLRTPWVAIREIGVVIKLSVGRDTQDLFWTERWVRDHIIGRIPGGRHTPKNEESQQAQGNQRGGS